MLRTLLALIVPGVTLAALPAAALAQAPDQGLRHRAEQLVGLVNGEADLEAMFTPDFLNAIPAAQLRTVGERLRAQHGRARRVEAFEATSPTNARVRIEAERATILMELAVAPEAPHRIQGLLVTGAEVRGDSLEAVAREIAALPGTASFAVARLGDGAPQILAGHDPETPLAIGSTFKLWILAELARQVRAGERRWDEIVALDRRSLPSGLLQDWPSGSPMTVHSLAALMISISDNTATDMLLHLAGREKVERLLPAIGVAAAGRNRPFLSTLEAFALKAAPDPAYQAWRRADEAGRRALLASDFAMRGPAELDPGAFGTAPRRIDVEWFASALDLVRTMDWLRREGGEEVARILAISPGMPAPAAGELAYVGYKGGSEPGVLNLTWLVRRRAGDWHVVTGSWNDRSPLEAERFADLLRRAVRLVR